MSGGHFDYKQYYLDDIADSIERYLNGVEVYEDSMCQWDHDHKRGWVSDEEWEYVKTNRRTKPNEYEYSQDTLNELQKGVEIIRLASIYAHRIDWLLSGDDGEESFQKNLKEELEKLKSNERDS